MVKTLINIKELIKESGFKSLVIAKKLGISKQTLNTWQNENKAENIEKVKNIIDGLKGNVKQDNSDLYVYLLTKIKNLEDENQLLRVCRLALLREHIRRK